MRSPLYTSRATSAADRGECCSAAVSSRSSSAADNPTVGESSDTLGRRTLATGEYSSSSTSRSP